VCVFPGTIFIAILVCKGGGGTFSGHFVVKGMLKVALFETYGGLHIRGVRCGHSRYMFLKTDGNLYMAV
jgi:hypothetical protein